jgi:hypothetical protein
MSYDWTEAGRNARVAAEQARYGISGGVVLGTDDTEANTAVTGEVATTHVGLGAVAAGSGTIIAKYTEVAGGTVYEEFGLKVGADLHVRRALDAPVTLTNIGDIVFVTVTVNAPAASA